MLQFNSYMAPNSQGQSKQRERPSENYPLLVIGSDTRPSPSFHMGSLWHFPSVSLVGQKDGGGS